MPITPTIIPAAEEQDWVEALDEVMLLLAAIPELKHVDIWMEQPEAEYQGDTHNIPKPAAFVSFMAEVEDLAHPVQHIKGVFKVWLYLATNADSSADAPAGNRADYFSFKTLLKKIHRALHGVSGNHFSGMHRISISEEAAAPMQILYSQSFACNVVDFTADPAGGEAQLAGISVTGDQVTSIPSPAGDVSQIPIYPGIKIS